MIARVRIPVGGRGARTRLRRRGIIAETRFGSSPSDGTPSTRFLTPSSSQTFPSSPSASPRKPSRWSCSRRRRPVVSATPRRHRAGASTLRARAPHPLLLNRPPPRPAVSFSWVLGQKLSSPPPLTDRIRRYPPRLRRSCSVSSARAPEAGQGAQVHGCVSPASHQGYIQPFSFPYLIHCEKNAHPRLLLTTLPLPFFSFPTLRHLPQGGAHRG